MICVVSKNNEIHPTNPTQSNYFLVHFDLPISFHISISIFQLIFISISIFQLVFISINFQNKPHSHSNLFYPICLLFFFFKSNSLYSINLVWAQYDFILIYYHTFIYISYIKIVFHFILKVITFSWAQWFYINILSHIHIFPI